MARKAMARTRSKLRAKDKEVLEAMEDTPGKKRRSRKAANSHRKDNAKTAPIPAKLRKAAKVTVKKLTDDWRDGGDGTLPLPKPDGVGRVLLENINSLRISNGLGPRQERPATMDQQRKDFDYRRHV